MDPTVQSQAREWLMMLTMWAFFGLAGNVAKPETWVLASISAMMNPSFFTFN
jgi:hypothetical protein